MKASTRTCYRSAMKTLNPTDPRDVTWCMRLQVEADFLCLSPEGTCWANVVAMKASFTPAHHLPRWPCWQPGARCLPGERNQREPSALCHTHTANSSHIPPYLAHISTGLLCSPGSRCWPEVSLREFCSVEVIKSNAAKAGRFSHWGRLVGYQSGRISSERMSRVAVSHWTRLYRSTSGNLWVSRAEPR